MHLVLLLKRTPFWCLPDPCPSPSKISGDVAEEHEPLLFLLVKLALKQVPHALPLYLPPANQISHIPIHLSFNIWNVAKEGCLENIGLWVSNTPPPSLFTVRYVYKKVFTYQYMNRAPHPKAVYIRL